MTSFPPQTRTLVSVQKGGAVVNSYARTRAWRYDLPGYMPLLWEAGLGPERRCKIKIPVPYANWEWSWWRICLQGGRSQLDSWVRKIRWRRDRLPTPVFWPGASHGLYSLWGGKALDRTEQLSLSFILNESEVVGRVKLPFAEWVFAPFAPPPILDRNMST